MRSRSSSTGYLIGGDTLAGRGAAVYGSDLIGGDTLAGRGAAVSGGDLIGEDTLGTLAGRRAAIAASSVKRHA